MPTSTFTPPALGTIERFRPPALEAEEAFVPPSLDSEEKDRAARGAALRAEQSALRERDPAGLYRDMALPRAVMPVEPARDSAGLYRDMAAGYRPDMAQGFKEAAFTPLASLVDPQTMARGLDMLAMGAEGAERAATGQPMTAEELQERMARDVTPGVASKVLSGVQQTAAGLTSPAAVAMLGAGPVVGALPAVAQRGVAAGFAGLMTAGAAQNAAEAIEAFKQDDVEGFARAASGFGLDATLALAGTYGAGRGLAANSPRITRWLTTEAQRTIPPEQIRASLERVDAGGGSPAEIELARLLRGSGVEGLAAGGGLTVRAQVPRVGPLAAEWLGVPRGRVTEVELRGQPAEPEMARQLADAPGVPAIRGRRLGAGETWMAPLGTDAEFVVNEQTGTTEFPALAGETPNAQRPTSNRQTVVPVETQTQLVDEPVRPVPAAEIVTRPDLMQFKRMSETETGVNDADKLAGKWDDRKAGVLLLWEPVRASEYGLAPGERYIVANGHHRFEFGERAARKGYNAQIVREADGFSASDARRIAAEVNIADGKGTIYDQAKYFRVTATTLGADEAVAAGRRIGARGRSAQDIGLHAADDLFTSFINEQVSPEQARAIALAAPGDAATQRVGLKYALEGKPADFIANVMQASRREAGSRGQTLDLFGADDTAMREMETQATRASQLQRDLRERLRVLNAGKQAEIAARENIDVKQPETIPARIAQIKSELTRWENWPLHPDLVARVKGVDKATPRPQPEKANETTPDNPRAAMVAGPDEGRLRAAEAVVGRGAPADASQRGTPQEIERQAALLKEWARGDGLLLPPDYFAGLERHLGTTAEHEVFYRPSDQRAVKRTLAGTFGVSPRAHGPGIGATPAFYLQRMALMNEVFDSKIRLEGITEGQSLLIGKGMEPSIVISQPWTRALDKRHPHPSEGQIAEFLRGLGFEPYSQGYFEWRRPDGIRVMDARDDNFILAGEGVVPIDLVVDRIPPGAAVGPQLRAGEMGTGDLLQGADAPFNLAGETGVDFERLAAEKAKAEADAAEAKRIAERDQLDMFSPKPPAGGGSGHASVGEFRAPVPALPAPAPDAPAGAGFADSGLFVDGVEVRLGGSGAVNPVLLPEIYRLFTDGMGGEAPFLRKYRQANGMFYPEGAGRIGLHPDLFKFPHQLAYTMAHEVGHAVDYAPDRTLERGNLFGRIGTLRQWLTTSFPLDPRTSLDEVIKPADRRKLRRQAEGEIGPRPAGDADRSAWNERVGERYQELVQNELDARGLVPLKQVRDELLALTQWWRPYDPAKVPESYRKYRESSVELYADALSVLFNSPGHLEKLAPTFYRMFWDWLERKPEVKTALAEVQALIRRGDAAVLRARLAEDKADFAKGREAFEAAHAEQERQFWDVKAIAGKLMRQLGDRGAALTKAVQAARGGGLLPKGFDMREAWEQSLMADNVSFRLLTDVAERVVKPLQAAGLDANVDLGIYLKHTRIQGNKSAREELDAIKARLGKPTYLLAEKFADLMEELTRKGLAETQMIDKVILPAEAAGIEFDDLTEINRLKLEQGTRVDLANPRLVQAAESERTLNQHLADLGPAKAEVLRQAAAAFRDLVFGVVERMHRAQLITERQFQTAQANRHTYAAFRSLDHVETVVSWLFRRAKGTAKAIENPFVTTLLKMQSAIHAALENEAKLQTRDGMQAVDPASFVKAETYWSGRGQQARPVAKGMERLVVREQGKPVAYDVDPAMAEAFEKLTPFEQNTAAAWVNWLFHQTLYKGYVSWSLPFNFWRNPLRDAGATHLSIRAQFGDRAPSTAELARAYKDAWADAKKYVNGELTPLAEDALKFFAIYAPTDAFYAQFPQDDPSHALFAKLGLVPEPVSRGRQFGNKLPVVKQALLLGDWIQHQGQMREAVGKLGPWLALQRAGIPREQAAAFIRNLAGTPNLKVSGSASAGPNAIMPFYRIYTQALLRWLRLTTNPTTRGGYWFRWATTRGVMRAMLAMAGLGWLGKELKDWHDGVPEYERTRGIPVPVPPLTLPGGDYGKKVAFLRLPDDEFSAFLGYSLDNALRTAAGQKDAGTAAGQAARAWVDAIPSLSPFLNIGGQWLAYGTGGVPEDTFRHRPVLTEAERKVGGGQALGKMALFTAEKAGVPFMSVLRGAEREATSDAESVLRFTPLLKDMVKITDGGYREQDMAQRDAVERVKYAQRMGYGDNTKSLLHRQAVLERAGATRTLPQEADWRYLQKWTTPYNHLDQAIVAAGQSGDKARAKELTGRLETLATRVKAAMEQRHAERDAERGEGPRLEPWNQPRLTNAVPRGAGRR